jgi:thiamine biosynthesis protein ThiI
MNIVVHYAELGLKGRNRPRFLDQLDEGIRRALRPLAPPRIQRLYGRVLVTLPDDVPFEAVVPRLSGCFGVAYFSRVTACAPTLAAMRDALDAWLVDRKPSSFGIRARRAEKRHPFRSGDVARELGQFVAERTGARVDLRAPELWIEIHVLTDAALILHERIAGPGGMPCGSAGRALSLISGGIDSPVASYEMMRRGARLDFVHFHSAPFTSDASVDKVRDIVGRLAHHQGRSLLHIIAFGAIQTQIASDAPPEPRIVLYRRTMLRIACAIATQRGARALVTGDSLGQVSSQTLANLDTINRAATLPVLRPLIATDKDQIVARARRIGTFETSIEPDQDCCGFLMPARPATSTRPEPLERIEAKLPIDTWVQDALATSEREYIEATT